MKSRRFEVSGERVDRSQSSGCTARFATVHLRIVD
jgi:hypothetical protein